MGLSGYFTMKRGKVESTSERQHRYLHAHCLDHTHIIDGKRRRHSWPENEEGKRCGKPCRQCGYKKKKK
jgi:hypothetical protein